jgi:acyl-CoA reductase-like NAD-dependent aldehyde dehydrogenase
MQTITKHYIDGAFVESHGSEVMDLVSPTTAQVIGHVTPAMRRMRGEPLRRLSARPQPSAGARRKSDLRSCAGCMRQSRRASTTCVPGGPTSKTAKPLPIAVPATLKARSART